MFETREPKRFAVSIVQLGNSQRTSGSKATINFMVSVRTADYSSIVWVHTVDGARGVEEGVAIYPICVSMDLVSSGLKLILSDALPKSILRREGALQHGKFLDQVKWRIDEILAALKFREGDGYAVEHHFVLKV